MRIKTLFITGIAGIAVVTGIYKGLSSPRKRASEEGEKKTEVAGEKEEQKKGNPLNTNTSKTVNRES
jgi:hypothetical protein